MKGRGSFSPAGNMRAAASIAPMCWNNAERVPSGDAEHAHVTRTTQERGGDSEEAGQSTWHDSPSHKKKKKKKPGCPE
eukprot:5037660-Prymnesium_polylepis.1